MRTTIKIVCQHPGGPTHKVATMVRFEDGVWRDWGGLTEGRTGEAHLVVHDADRSATADLIGDRLAQTNINAPGLEEAERVSHTLRCGYCDLTVAMRGERLDPLLDKALEHGFKEVPLRVLGA